MNKKLLIFIFVLIALPLFSAVVEESFAFGTNIDLKRPCFNNGTYCSSATICNITVIYPSGDLLLDNVQMNNQISFHNASIVAADNNELGIHPAYMTCIDSPLNGEDTFEIEITGNGFPSQQFPREFVIIILAFILIGVGATVDKLKLLKYLGSLITMVMGVITLYPGYANINFSTLFGKVLGFSLIGVGFYFLIEDSFSRERQVEGFDQDDPGLFDN